MASKMPRIKFDQCVNEKKYKMFDDVRIDVEYINTEKVNNYFPILNQIAT